MWDVLWEYTRLIQLITPFVAMCVVASGERFPFTHMYVYTTLLTILYTTRMLRRMSRRSRARTRNGEEAEARLTRHKGKAHPCSTSHMLNINVVHTVCERKCCASTRDARAQLPSGSTPPKPARIGNCSNVTSNVVPQTGEWTWTHNPGIIRIAKPPGPGGIGRAAAAHLVTFYTRMACGLAIRRVIVMVYTLGPSPVPPMAQSTSAGSFGLVSPVWIHQFCLTIKKTGCEALP